MSYFDFDSDDFDGGDYEPWDNMDRNEMTSPVDSINCTSDFVNSPTPPTTPRYSYSQSQPINQNRKATQVVQNNEQQSTGHNHQPFTNTNNHFLQSYQPIAVNSYQPMAMNNCQQIAVNNMNTAWWSYHFNPFCQPQMCSPIMAYPVQLGPYATAGQFQMMAPNHPMVPVFQQQTNFQNGFPVVPQPTCNTPAAYSFGDNRTVQHNIKGDSIMNNSSIVNHGTINIHPRV